MRTCAECGCELTVSTGPGRICRYRGQDGYEMPADLTFDKCAGCGAEWMPDTQIDRLGASLEEQRKKRTA